MRYFFDIVSSRGQKRDEEGDELDGLETARKEAFLTLAELVRSNTLVTDGEATLEARVRDATGRALFVARMRLDLVSE
ncbi:DUF6894 family protein [Alsobacter sp. SYSU BS001988]